MFSSFSFEKKLPRTLNLVNLFMIVFIKRTTEITRYFTIQKMGEENDLRRRGREGMTEKEMGGEEGRVKKGGESGAGGGNTTMDVA